MSLEQNKVAEATYRALWEEHGELGCGDPADERRRFLEREMDRIQPQIGTSPADPRWQAFFKTLEAEPERKPWWRFW